MPIVAFVLLTFVASWLLWIAAAAVMHWDFSFQSGLVAIGGPLYLLGVFAPAIVAVALTARSEGRGAVKALLERTIQWSVGARWYLFAIAYFAAIKLGVALLHRGAMGEYPAFSPEPWFVMLAAIPISTPVQAGEEIGWRGFLLPRLSARVGRPTAGIIVGVIWATWHLPFFLIAGADKSGQSFPAYLLAVTALSVAMAWLYWRTGGSLLLTMLMHAAVNNTNFVSTPPPAEANAFAVKSSLVAWSTVALLWVCAVAFLVDMRRAQTRAT